MNGECKSYRLNDPMTWAEFKDMPDDLKIKYISMIRNAYGVSDNFIANHLFRVSQPTVGAEMRRLGIGLGKHSGSGKASDRDSFLAWCGVKALAQTEPEEFEDVCEEYAEPVNQPTGKVIPCSGDLTFVGAVEDVLASVADILGGTNVRIHVMWEVCQG